MKGSGNSLDFGARIHDPRIGRFLSLDALANVNPSSSAYSFAGNSPLVIIDIGGNFKIKVTDAAREKYGLTEAKLTRFVDILQRIEGYLIENPNVLAHISAQTGFSKEEILKSAQFGSGPTIIINENPKVASVSREDAKNNEMQFDGSLVLTLSEMQFSDDSEEQAFLLAGASLVLHEYTHLGDRQNNNGNITGQSDGDKDANGNLFPATQLIKQSRLDHRGADVDYAILRKSVGVSQDENGNHRFVDDTDLRGIRYKLNQGEIKPLPETKP